jgi:H+/Cl- antiporter ClcA
MAAILLGYTDSLFLPLLGGACMLSAAYRIPLVGMMLVIEWGGGFDSILLGLICVVIAQACMGRQTIAPNQTDSPGVPARTDP